MNKTIVVSRLFDDEKSKFKNETIGSLNNNSIGTNITMQTELTRDFRNQIIIDSIKNPQNRLKKDID